MSAGVLISFVNGITAAGGIIPIPVSNANPLPVTLSGGLSGLEVSGVTPVGVIPTTNPVLVGGTDATGAVRDLSTDGTGNLNVNVVAGGGSSTVTQGPGNLGTPWTVGGGTAAGSSPTTFPVMIAGIARSTVTTGVANGQVAIFNTDISQNLVASIVTKSLTGSDGLSNTSSIGLMANATNYGNNVLLVTGGYNFNGVSWDRVTKPRTASRLASSAASNNATVAKASPGTVFGISCQILTTVNAAYLKFFDGTTAPNPAVATPLYVFPLTFITGNTGLVQLMLPSQGFYMPTGITWAITALPADLDNTSIAAGQVVSLNILFQ